MWPLVWNPTYWLFVAPAILFTLYAQWRVRSAYARWEKVPNEQGIPGVNAAEQLLQQNDLYGVRIRGVQGRLTDHYDPRNNTLGLSEATARQGSVAALAVVAHEIGHAKQAAQGSLLLKARSGLVPVVNFGSQLGPILFIIGYFLTYEPLMYVGIAFFSLAFVFAVLTLPLELDASNKAMRMLRSSNLIIGNRELRGARAVLNAAALTYVASMLTALFQLLYYVFLARGGRRRR
jgi:Zn-dependent membrane protease YugP